MVTEERQLTEKWSKSADGRPLLTIPPTDAFIPGDIHIPFHNKKALDAAIDYASGFTDTAILIGDTFDNFGLSTWPKDTKKLVRYRIVDEIASAEPVIKKLDRTFRRVYYIPGNHEARWENVLRKTPALDGLEWWWPLRGVLPSHWELLPINVQLRFKAADGRWVHIEHGDKVNRNSAYVTVDKLTTLYPDQITIIGHNHRLAAHHRTHWFRNRSTSASSYSVGHLSDVKKTDYVSNPDWQTGFALLHRTGHVDLKQVYRGRVL